MTSSCFGLFLVIDISGNDFIDLSVLAVILILDLLSSVTKVHHGVDLFSFWRIWRDF